MIMRLAIRYIIVISCWLFFAMTASAQVLVKASLDKDSILIGEPLRLVLDVRVPLGHSITWFALDTIPHFTILQKGNIDTADDIDGKKMEQMLTITSFDSGRWQIPSLALAVDKKNYYTDTVPIAVGYAPFDPAEDYHDIKAIEEVPNPSAGYIPWMIAAGTLVALVLMIYLLQSKKSREPAQKPQASALSPYDEAMEALKALQKQGWPQNGQVKPYYTSLNDILRIFVLRKMNLSTMEKTNEELILQLRQLNLPPESFSQLAQALRMADFVKFARYQPDRSENEKNFSIIESAIKTLNNIS